MKRLIRWLAARFGLVAIEWRTAEYLAVLSGNVAWGNPKRRNNACADLSAGMRPSHRAMATSSECFDGNTIECKDKRHFKKS